MSEAKKHEFQAEIQQVLDIVINSLYTDKEIFVRELVSNGSDALEKLRYRQAAGDDIHDADLELTIDVNLDEEAGTISISDTGIGMTEEELIENLGTIAHSGSKAFIKQVSEEKEGSKDAAANLIGQFGVGFYSSFMVADKVEVETRSWQKDAKACRWTSNGAGSYEIEEIEEAPRGTKITIFLKEDHKGFSKKGEAEGIIRRYSNFVSFPIKVDGEIQNTVQAIWARSKSDIKEEEYTEFYKFIGHDGGDPMFRLHFSADAPLVIQSVLFVPSRNMEMPGMPKSDPGVGLYCRKVLIDSSPKNLLPEWMRFVKGVVDSEDLPLNISRESMQDSALVAKLGNVITKRFIKLLNEKATKAPEEYDAFWNEFARYIKEGVVSDFTRKEELGKLLRYESSITEKGKLTSFKEYVERVTNEDQKDIYYAMASSREAAEASAYYEVFAEKKIEVLFLYDPWDEFVMDHLMEFDGKKLVSVEKAELELDKPEEGEERLSDEDAEELSKWLKESLGEKVNEVRISKRLTKSPAVIAEADQFMTASMRRMMKSMNREGMPEKLDLEINPGHELTVKLNKARTDNTDLADLIALQIFDNSKASAGLLEDPREMLQRMNDLMAKAMG
ncbi:molecular chaperone HtpG [Verrucomicrobia bacterium]|nr:molecular chaperone HtpG [Verrucomicrobiota bacterium]